MVDFLNGGLFGVVLALHLLLLRTAGPTLAARIDLTVERIGKVLYILSLFIFAFVVSSILGIMFMQYLLNIYYASPSIPPALRVPGGDSRDIRDVKLVIEYFVQIYNFASIPALVTSIRFINNRKLSTFYTMLSSILFSTGLVSANMFKFYVLEYSKNPSAMAYFIYLSLMSLVLLLITMVHALSTKDKE